jgi:IPT/TIG domain
MKRYLFFTHAILMTAVLMICVIGCKYDVAEPQWDKPAPPFTSPSVTGIVPAAAVAGVNTITINGQSFSDSLSDMTVYFDAVTADIISTSGTSIVVRRPNVVSANSVVKVVSSKAYVAAKLSPYEVDQVWSAVGGFVANLSLASVIVDSTENLYVTSSTTPYTTWKVDPSGASNALPLTVVAPTALRITSDAKVHAGKLYLFGKGASTATPAREIQVVDLAANTISRAFRMPAGRGINFGDFTSNGYLVAGGTKSDLIVAPPNATGDLTAAQIKTTGAYAAEDILAIRVYSDGNVYVASKVGALPAIIYKQTIDAAGNLGTRTQVLDMNTTIFASRLITGLNISSTGKIFITTQAPNPLLVFDPANNSIDYFYKELLSHVLPNTTPAQTKYWLGKQACWGPGTNLYMIANDTAVATDNALKWNVMKVSMGSAGSQYY